MGLISLVNPDPKGLATRLSRIFGVTRQLRMQVSDVVQPIYDAKDAMWSQAEGLSGTVDVSSVNTLVGVWWVSKGEEWRIIQLYKGATTGACCLGIQLAADLTITNRLTVPGAGAEMYDGLASELVLPADSCIGMVGAANGADSSIGIELIFQRRRI